MSEESWPSPVQKMALDIIRGIEEHGHFQDRGGFGPAQFWSQHQPENPCCVVANPGYQDAGNCAYRDEFRDAFVRASGVDATGLSPWAGAAIINDCLSTDEVLDALWAVALG